jgi:hypothetical protein
MSAISNDKESYVILTPLPQLTGAGEIEQDCIALKDDGLFFSRMTPEVRRTLLDVSKASECSDDVLSALVESDLLFWALIPSPLPSILDELPIVRSVDLYSFVAEAILERLFNCLMICSLVPPPLPHYCWFYAPGSLGQIDLSRVNIAEPAWEPKLMPFHVDWRDPTVTQRDVGPGFSFIGRVWDRLAPVVALDRIREAFCSEAKWTGYLNAGQAYADRKADELTEARSAETGARLEPQHGGGILDDAFLDGCYLAYGREINKLAFGEAYHSRGQRVVRALQFLSDSMRLPVPHRFVALTTCLEALFSKEPSEVTFQLASRTAWFLEPDNASERHGVFEEVISSYGLRSAIVHGRVSNIKSAPKYAEHETNLVILVRRVMMRFFMDASLYDLTFTKEPKAYDEYLTQLSLGGNDPLTRHHDKNEVE